jgi:glycosyltransferase involved in cell wall biosynthesis
MRTHREKRFLFLGSLEQRKGFPVLSDAWTTNAESGYFIGRLTILGKGPLEAAALELKSAWPSDVEVMLDPPRTLIHEALRGTDYLVLMSQPEARWREQIGLPLLEALAHGVHVVTTEESGLAPWLEANGHTVLASSCGAAKLACTLRALSEARIDPESILAKLPERDQRIVADQWLCEDSQTGS